MRLKERFDGIGSHFFRKKEKWLNTVAMAFDTVILRTNEKIEVLGQLFSFARFVFRMKMRVKLDFCILHGFIPLISAKHFVYLKPI